MPKKSKENHSSVVESTTIKPAKSMESKKAAAAEKETSAPVKSSEAAPAASEKKADAPVKPTGTKVPPAASENKPDTPVKPAGTKAVPAAGDKKTETPTKPADTRTAHATGDKKPETPVKPIDAKAAPAAGPAKDTAVEPPKGIKVTQVFADRLDKPDETALKSLPIPQEGEGFTMRLHPAYFFEFLDHPFTVNREVKDYKELYDSIRDNGINEPVKARPRKDGGLELLSGHRRHDIAAQLGYPVPVVIVPMDDDSARIEVVDGNLHRQDIPTSELARAAKMKLDALARRAGRRSKMEQLAGPQKRTDEIVGEDMGMSRNQVQRLVRVNDLVPELKQQVDDKSLPFNTGVALSYLSPEEQKEVVEVIKEEGAVPSLAQATALKEASREAAKAEKTAEAAQPAKSADVPVPRPAKLDKEKISSIVKPRAEPEIKYTFTSSELKEYFPKDKAPTVSEVKRRVFNALDLQRKMEEKQKAKQALKDAAKDR